MFLHGSHLLWALPSSGSGRSNLFRNLVALLVIPASVGTFLGAPPAKAQNAYITNAGNKSVSVINTATNTVTATISVGNNPGGVAVTRDGSTVYVANSRSDSVSVIATASDTVTTTIGGFNHPFAFGLFIGTPPRPPKFAGTPGQPNCYGKSVSALSKKYGTLDAAAQALGYPSVQALRNAVESFCGQ